MKRSSNPFRPTTSESSDFSITPRSNQQFEMKTRSSKIPLLAVPERLDIKDMLISASDQRANVSVWRICLAAAVGIGAGILLSTYKVDGDWAQWIALPGDLFISALKCLIVPMVFCSVVVCMGELVAAGKAAQIGSRMIIFFMMASVASSTIGTTFGFIFAHTYNTQMTAEESNTAEQLTFRCHDGSYLTMAANGAMACRPQANVTADPNALFTLNDTTGFFTASGTKFTQLSVSEQIFSILNDLVPENIVGSFAGTSTLSVITFAIWFGVACVKSLDRTHNDNYILLLVTQANIVSRLMINAVVAFIPFAIVSMVAGSMAEFSSRTSLLEGVGFLIVSLVCALATNTLGVMGTALFLTTGRNVFSYLKNIIPAQVFILGCASSMATLPLTMRCVDATREVSYSLSRFVLPLGATSNLNGTATYMPLACIFMAKVGGYEHLLTPVRYILLGFVSSIASFGVAAVPHSGLVMVITVWRTVFGVDVPPVFSLLVGTDWILDRLRSVVNITNDTIIVRMIASQTDEAALRQLENAGDGLLTPESAHP
ncbi:Dicarboxylate/amino acid:cation symporter, partial [Globisporangium splendens]